MYKLTYFLIQLLWAFHNLMYGNSSRSNDTFMIHLSLAELSINYDICCDIYIMNSWFVHEHLDNKTQNNLNYSVIQCVLVWNDVTHKHIYEFNLIIFGFLQ